MSDNNQANNLDELSKLAEEYSALSHQLLEFVTNDITPLIGDSSLTMDARSEAAKAAVCIAESLVPDTEGLDSDCRTAIANTGKIIAERKAAAGK